MYSPLFTDSFVDQIWQLATAMLPIVFVSVVFYLFFKLLRAVLP